jgi:hypothetical protein
MRTLVGGRNHKHSPVFRTAVRSSLPLFPVQNVSATDYGQLPADRSKNVDSPLQPLPKFQKKPVNPPKFTFQHSAHSLCLRLSSVSSPVLRRLGGGGAEEDASVVASLRSPLACLSVHSRLPKNVDVAFPSFSLRPPVQNFSSHWPVRTSHLFSPKSPAIPPFPPNPTWLWSFCILNSPL